MYNSPQAKTLEGLAHSNERIGAILEDGMDQIDSAGKSIEQAVALLRESKKQKLTLGIVANDVATKMLTESDLSGIRLDLLFRQSRKIFLSNPQNNPEVFVQVEKIIFQKGGLKTRAALTFLSALEGFKESIKEGLPNVPNKDTGRLSSLNEASIQEQLQQTRMDQLVAEFDTKYGGPLENLLNGRSPSQSEQFYDTGRMFAEFSKQFYCMVRVLTLLVGDELGKRKV